MKNEKYILSCGMGQNSVSLAIWLKNNKKPLDLIIFSDTGSEESETYEYIPIFKKWCESNNITFIIVKSEHYPLHEYYLKHNLIPTRQYRHCTDKFKIRPFNKFIKHNFPETIFNIYIGIGSDEDHRKKTFEQYESKNRKYLFPFVDVEKVGRKESIDIIKKENLPIPVKSGCFLCPYQSKKVWVNRVKIKPEEVETCIILEENCKLFPDITLMGKTKLRDLKLFVKEQTFLSDWFDDDEGLEIDQCSVCML